VRERIRYDLGPDTVGGGRPALGIKLMMKGAGACKVRVRAREFVQKLLYIYSKLKEEFVQRTTLLKPGTISLTRPDKPNDTVTIGPHVRVRSWKRPTLMSFARPFRSPAAHEPLRGCIFAIEREIEILSLSLSLSPRRASAAMGGIHCEVRIPW
jgi:hypothetical protein